MARRTGKGKGRRGRQQVSTMHAPTMQGMQQVNTWNLYQVVPVLIPSGNQFNPDQPCQFQLVAGPNRWFWVVNQDGQNVAVQTLLYGASTRQFIELSALWETYRLDSVQIKLIPNNTGAGQMTSIISAIQPAGDTQPLANQPTQNILEQLSRLRTVDPAQFSGQRELYPEAGNNNAPLIRMAFQTTPGVQVGNGLALAFVRINAKYTVRGRRVTPLAAPIRYAQMTEEEKAEITRVVLDAEKKKLSVIQPPQRYDDIREFHSARFAQRLEE